MPLAVSSYEHLQALADRDDVLLLAWTVDEQACLGADLPEVLRAEITRQREYGEAFAAGPESDPHGEAVLRPTLAERFWPALAGEGCSVTCAAGVNALLHGLSALAASGAVWVIGDAYPDYPHWVGYARGHCRHAPTMIAGQSSSAAVAAHIDRARACAAAVVLIDRPNLGGVDLPLDAVCELANALRVRGTVVVVDESYANYHAPDFSAATLLAEAPNLCVLRGLSKGYQLGSLRLGIALAGAWATARVRAAIVPAQVSPLSLRLARAVLALGDITMPLRERVAENKPQMIAWLARLGIDALPLASPVPYLFLDDLEAAPRCLEARGVIGKRQPYWSADSGQIAYRYRLSVPLAPHRRDDLRCRLATA